MEEIAEKIGTMSYEDLIKIGRLVRKRTEEFESRPFDYPSLPREIREAVADRLDRTTASRLALAGRIGREDAARGLREELKAALASIVANSEKDCPGLFRIPYLCQAQDRLVVDRFSEIVKSDGDWNSFAFFGTEAKFLDETLEDLNEVVFSFSEIQVGKTHLVRRHFVTKPTVRCVIKLVMEELEASEFTVIYLEKTHATKSRIELTYVIAR